MSLKYKMLLKDRHPDAATDKDRKTLSTYDKALCMLVLHNSKIDKIQQKYRKEMTLKAQAKEQGITYQELLKKESETVVAVPKSKPKKGAKGLDVVIVMKDKDG